MLAFFRVLFVGIIVVSGVGMYQHGFWLGIGVFLFLMVVLWLLMVACDFCVAVGGILRPCEQTHMHMHVEHHPDPTRPDEHPLIVLNKTEYRRKKWSL
jgi:hypothetical protein